MIIIVVVAVAVVSGTAAGGYALTRPGAPLANIFGPPPAITVQSAYHMGTTPAGSTSTTLQVRGQQFAANSAITLLLDGAPISNARTLSSDAQGNFGIDLTIGANWALGTHTLSAKDAQGHQAASGVRVAIVPQGEAHTPGPNGAPPDDTSFTLIWSPNGDPRQYPLIITGRPDPAGGSVCGPMDDGQVHTVMNVVDSRDGAQQATTCAGAYKGGQLNYTQTILSWQYGDTSLSCQETSVPQIDFEIMGTFSSATAISGTIVITSYALTCTDGSTNAVPARNDTWTATVSTTP